MTSDRSEDINKLPFGPPPIFPDIKEKFEGYLNRPEKLNICNKKKDIKFWPEIPDSMSLLYAEIGPVATTLKFTRHPGTGKIADYREISVGNLGITTRNSASFTRPPTKATDDIRGACSNSPFWPGGFDPLVTQDKLLENDGDIDFEKDFFTKAPFLSSGIVFPETGDANSNPISENLEISDANSNLTSEDLEISEVDSNLISEDLEISDLEADMEKLQINPDEEFWYTAAKSDKSVYSSTAMNTENEFDEENALPAKSADLDITALLEDFKMSALRISIKDVPTKTSKVTSKTEWAEVLNSEEPVLNFNEKVVKPAKEYPFELDIFQKQAILKLEEREHVFVAAHTSAGKTVVAEYAIALCFKHHSRAIYTSPIKALSNQKYRDFQKQFGNVGLITGDYQINQTATCLVMTTEILRTMLFKGSAVIRELEYVIFDEVHYINDSERGHVWEEALIMLPDSVCIVMLSATVPNTLEFADWVARTKKRKVYVVSTSKRPVPLKHYLFTGVEGKGPNVFLVKDGDGPFIMEGYKKAGEHFEKKQVEIVVGAPGRGKQLGKPGGKTEGAGRGGGASGGKNQQKTVLVEKNMFKRPPSDKHYLMALLNYLTKFNKLPVVAFTLSRKKCDNLAYMLMVKDLTSSTKEKSYIHRFFQRNISHLKEDDQKLPQVRWMKELLGNGIGVHHSGILPILREIVEILFQEGCIKFLFATETFAMGVNMPARTVIFDSTEKYDGLQMRDFRPAEYIQMAGRAGRRGLDDAGTVIIMCKGSVPQCDNLIKMMTGVPTKLESQFRMTYSMILNTLRIQHMCIEDIMSRSFKEVNSCKMKGKYVNQLNDLRKVMDTPTDIAQDVYEIFENFYNVATNFINFWNYSAVGIFGSSNAQKILQPGRIVLIIHKEHGKKLAVILQCFVKTVSYKVLVLCDPANDVLQKDDTSKRLVLDDIENSWFKFLALSAKNIFVPSTGIDHHKAITVDCADILEITSFVVKADISLIISDLEQRQVPRFRKDKPNKSCMTALSMLYEKSVEMNNGMNSSDIISLSELKIVELDAFTVIEKLSQNKQMVYSSFDKLLNIPDYDTQLQKYAEIKKKEIKRKELEHLLSDKSLLTYPEYINKINVLHELGYIDDEKRTTTKGNAACNMSTHELILTELIFHNKLSSYESAEIVALLSCLVFTGKTDHKPKLGKRLKKGVQMMHEIVHDICQIESKNQIASEICVNKNLVQVVYNWASGKDFCDIMEIIPDVQEGIIVRCILQLHEILHCIKFVVGTYAADTILKDKIEEASNKIRRDIVFTESLYTKNQTEDNDDDLEERDYMN